MGRAMKTQSGILAGILFSVIALASFLPEQVNVQLKQKRPLECGGKSEPVCARTTISPLSTSAHPCYVKAAGV